MTGTGFQAVDLSLGRAGTRSPALASNAVTRALPSAKAWLSKGKTDLGWDAGDAGSEQPWLGATAPAGAEDRGPALPVA